MRPGLPATCATIIRAVGHSIGGLVPGILIVLAIGVVVGIAAFVIGGRLPVVFSWPPWRRIALLRGALGSPRWWRCELRTTVAARAVPRLHVRATLPALHSSSLPPVSALLPRLPILSASAKISECSAVYCVVVTRRSIVTRLVLRCGAAIAPQYSIRVPCKRRLVGQLSTSHCGSMEELATLASRRTSPSTLSLSGQRV